MSFEMDFLPDRYRVAFERRTQRRRSTVLMMVVLSGILITEVALRTRIASLRATEFHAQKQADAVYLRSSQVEQFQRQHQESLEELQRWAAPLRPMRGSVVLDTVLAARTPSMTFSSIEWSCGALLDENASPTLRISGEIPELHALSGFIRKLASVEGLPRLEVRRSGRRQVSQDEGLQEFELESIPEARAAL